jgi:hypothetical protein
MYIHKEHSDFPGAKVGISARPGLIEIDRLFVPPSCHLLGAGSYLFKIAMECAGNMKGVAGVNQVNVICKPDNPADHDLVFKLLLSQGFELDDSEGSNNLMMKKDLD